MRAALGVVVVLVGGFCCGQEQAKKEQTKIPKEVQEELAYFVGNWTLESHIGDSTGKGKVSIRWAPGKHCVVSTSASVVEGERQHSTAISGWDSSGWITEQGITCDGLVYTTRYTKGSPTTLEGKSSGTHEGNTGTAKVTIEKKGPDNYTTTLTDIVIGGEAVPDVVTHYTRVAKAAKGKAKK
jgi:hypothetical protein